ncbi:RYR3 protein, partial [Amazona guildingii]|nr:RYR3 protein [Amazona guildingii]
PATLKELISQTMVRWSQEDQIQDPELVRIMYTLLRRQYDSIGELLQALRKAYTISAVSVKDTINLLAALGQIRSLLSVRMGKEEEMLMINGLGCPPRREPDQPPQECVWIWCILLHPSWEICIVDYLSEMPVQQHICYGEQIGRIRDLCVWSQGPFPSMRGSTPLDVAAASVMDNNELALALEEPDLDKVVTYLAGCGLQSCPVLLAKGYPDIGWNPIEGERYLSFLRFAVFVN